MSTLSNFQAIPVVDVSGLYGSTEEQLAVAAELSTVAREVGFLYVTGSGVSQELFDDLLAVTKEFFALPLEEKMRTYIGNSSNHRGYVPTGEEGGYDEATSEAEQKPADLKEAFDLSLDLPVDDPDYLAGNPMVGPNQWPELPEMAETVNRYYNAVLAFGKVLLRGFALALGEAPETFDAMVTKAPSQLRLIHYPFDPSAVDSQGIGAHTDFEVFTLLKPTKPGLEVLNGAGEWIDAPPMDGAFIVNIADMLEIWTNGAFISTTHRVRKVAEERYSFPLFFNVDYDTLVAPLERFQRADGTNKLPLKAGEHLYAQTVQVFAYLRKRLAAGEISMPDVWLETGSFGREADLNRGATGAADPTLVSAAATNG
ncbi:isopenicillin N synthase-like dioxygenase [Jatrophihabitans sp. GAS493]|uniref:isopenicillin N synthase family dioxygenase n=1 Tax=Jatrophihabitans sp. GAS493 TaxID=1907575 RepID=UPI000BB8A7AF|nr:2-oxoglutarate and iron-dependent oxygenase domain-containing protein [Jatrophihabitans sp. GAS493]SOD74826.1 isopenicillin N synthase-like dioxygenase [Jatrophihabitans sp. GAS493]